MGSPCVDAAQYVGHNCCKNELLRQVRRNRIRRIKVVQNDDSHRSCGPFKEMQIRDEGSYSYGLTRYSIASPSPGGQDMIATSSDYGLCSV